MRLTRRFFDRVQVMCYLLDLPNLARFFSRFGTPVLEAPVPSTGDRPTLRCPVYVAQLEPVTGLGFCTGELPDVGPLEIIDYDPTVSDTRIDPSHDVVFASSKEDVN